jgi:hypothetical protein
MTLVINESRFHEMTTSQNGAIGVHLARTGVRVESAAKALVTTEGLVRTGRYRSSLGWNLLASGTMLVLRVGSALPIARLLERGSPPHLIAARRTAGGNPAQGGAGGLFWEQKPNVGTRNWFVPDHPLQAVNHPGTRPYRIIARAVEQVLRHRA